MLLVGVLLCVVDRQRFMPVGQMLNQRSRPMGSVPIDQSGLLTCRLPLEFGGALLGCHLVGEARHPSELIRRVTILNIPLPRLAVDGATLPIADDFLPRLAPRALHRPPFRILRFEHACHCFAYAFFFRRPLSFGRNSRSSAEHNGSTLGNVIDCLDRMNLDNRAMSIPARRASSRHDIPRLCTRCRIVSVMDGRSRERSMP